MARQAGMTLIELTVVLLVLVGLAGLMIPYVSGFVGKTHDATGSANLAGVANAITRFETENGSYPNKMDSLLLADGSAMVDYMMATTPLTAYNASIVDMSDQDICWGLRKAGITQVTAMDAGTKANFNPTFNNDDATTPTITLMTMGMGSTAPMCAAASKVVEITNAEAKKILGRVDVTKRYVVFGLGQANTAVGKTLQDAPVHFAKSGNMNASNKYNRFLAVFELWDRDLAGTCSDTAGSESEAACLGLATPGTWTAATASWATARPARLAGTAMAMMELTGLGTELGSYYTNASN